ncbi:MAG: hypothetical protein WDN72_06435 [Alphaproteobacteria bacterium]
MHGHYPGSGLDRLAHNAAHHHHHFGAADIKRFYAEPHHAHFIRNTGHALIGHAVTFGKTGTGDSIDDPHGFDGYGSHGRTAFVGGIPHVGYIAVAGVHGHDLRNRLVNEAAHVLRELHGHAAGHAAPLHGAHADEIGPPPAVPGHHPAPGGHPKHGHAPR